MKQEAGAGWVVAVIVGLLVLGAVGFFGYAWVLYKLIPVVFDTSFTFVQAFSATVLIALTSFLLRVRVGGKSE